MIDQEQIEAFKIIGIEQRTTNENQQSQADLGLLWDRFNSENIIQTIPNKVTTDIYAVYTDYESDYTGAYTVILGCKVNTFENLPEGLVGLELKGGKYLKYTAKGKLPDAVVSKWMEIWEQNDSLNRKYTVDFEVYGPKSHDPEHAEVEIYIAVRE
jgi:predicted transcriptional regulator YdeE